MRNFRDLTHARRRSPAPAPRHTRRPATGVRLHHRTLEHWCDPEAAFVALYGDHEHAVWLDSSRAEPGLARFSYMGAPDGPLGQVVRYDVATHTLTIERAGRTEHSREHVFDYCERELARLRADAPELPFDFTCGFAGAFGYELKADLGGALAHRSPLPDAALVFCDRLIAFDHERRRVHLLALGDAAGAADAWLAATERALEGLVPPAPPAAPRALSFTAREGRDAYLANIAACMQEIFEGETYEVCLTTELHSDGAIDPLAAYRALRARNPAPHAALLRLGDISVLSSSPERFLRVDRERVVESKPIKGTAPRGLYPTEDAYRAAALRADDKSRAENLMIVDLVRNDLGRVCALGQRRGAGADGRRVLRDRPPARHDGPGPAARGRVRDRLHPRGVSRRFDDGRAEAAHDGDHRPARGRPARLLLGRAGVPVGQRHRRPQHRHPHARRVAPRPADRVGRRDRRRLGSARRAR